MGLFFKPTIKVFFLKTKQIKTPPPKKKEEKTNKTKQKNYKKPPKKQKKKTTLVYTFFPYFWGPFYRLKAKRNINLLYHHLFDLFCCLHTKHIKPPYIFCFHIVSL